MNACTIIARNYLPLARVLARSFHEHNPGGTFTTLIIDDRYRSIDDTNEPFRVWTLADLGLEDREIHNMAMIYDIMELATAAKPFLLRRLHEEGADHAVYFDPDIRIYANVEEIADLSRAHGIVLTPHVLEPVPRDDKVPDENEFLKAGIYNLGFIAVGASARPFLDWWCERLARDCIADASESFLFVDQKWVDFVPSLFPGHYIHRDPGCNVAYWNLGPRVVTRSDKGRYTVNGSALKFFHFSGYNPDKPFWLSKFLSRRSRVLLSEHPAVARLCREYGEAEFAEGYREIRGQTYGWGELPSGRRISHVMRRLYRSGVIAAELRGDPMPPDPFDPESAESFLTWINTAPDQRSAVSRLLMATWQSNSAVRLRFPELRGDPARHFLAWMRKEGWRQTGVDVDLIDVTSESPLRQQIGPVESSGVNLVGYFHAESGVGEVGRIFSRILDHAREPYAVVRYLAAPQPQALALSSPGAERATHDVNIVCVNADQMPHLRHDAGPQLFEGRKTIGVWFWDVEDFPKAMHNSFDLVHEVWVPSQHTADALRRQTTKPVVVVPLPIDVPEVVPEPDRARFGLGDEFVFLLTFDLLSVPERKNPKGLVSAFRNAFGDDPAVRLVIKTNGGVIATDHLEELRNHVLGMSNVTVFDTYFSTEDRDRLVASCDCFVSLHRAEGYGLGMAEAMAFGKPVIATGYAGNLAFMNEANSYLVKYAMVRIGPGNAPYPADGLWAEPDIEHAAALMREVVADPDAARKRGAAAREDVRRNHSMDQTVAVVISRLAAVRAAPAARNRFGRQSMTEAGKRTGAKAASSLPGRLALRALRRAFRPELDRLEDRYRDSAGAVARLGSTVEGAEAAHERRIAELEARVADLTTRLGQTAPEPARDRSGRL